MRGLVVALCLIAARAGAVSYSPIPTALYDVEQNVSDTVGTNHGTPSGSPTYSTTGAWSNTYSISGGYFNVPISLVGITGTAEFSFRTAAVPANSKAIFGVQHNGNRVLEFYQFGNQIYAYDASAGVNAPFINISANTNYYLKMTWNATRRIVYSGVWSTPGSVTLTKVTDVANTYLNGTIASVVVHANTLGQTYDGYMDFIAFRNVFDDSATIVAPVSSTAPGQLSPYMNNFNTPNMMPKLFLFLHDLFVSRAYALSSNQNAEQDWNEYQLWKSAQARATKTPTPAPTATPNPAWTKTPTPGPTATATRTPVP